MAYSDFELPDLAARFGVKVADHSVLFAGVAGVVLSRPVAGLLSMYLPLAIAKRDGKSPVGIADG